MKRTTKIFSLAAALVASLFLPPLSALADGQGAATKLGFAPIGGNEVPGYVNSTNTSFEVRVDLSDLEDPYVRAEVTVMPAGSVAEEVLQSFTEPGIVTFAPPTGKSPQDYFSDGENTIYLRYFQEGDDEGEIKGEPVVVIADYTLPAGVLSYETSPPGKSLLAVGDKVNFFFTPFDPSEEVSAVNGLYNDRELTFSKVGGAFAAIYEVCEGDADQQVPLPLCDVAVSDAAGNVFEPDCLEVDFGIDANPPEVSIVSPENGKIYGERDIVFRFGSSEPVSVSAWLNGKQVVLDDGAYLAGLEDGDYRLEVEFCDEAGNCVREQVEFKVALSPLPVDQPPIELEESKDEAKDEEPPVKLARAHPAPAMASDAPVKMISVATEEPLEVAKEGKIFSSEDARGVNWSAWIILLALIALASALATAGYYGYEWVTAGSAGARAARAPRRSPSDEDAEQESPIQKETEAKDEPDDSSQDPPAPKTRW